MSWQDLLCEDEEKAYLWIGGRTVYGDGRSYKLKGPMPSEFGWYCFNVSGGRFITLASDEMVEPEFGWEDKYSQETGYLTGNRFIRDKAVAGRKGLSAFDVVNVADPVFFLERGLDLFERITCAHYEGKFYVYLRQEFLVGPEIEMRDAYHERKEAISCIPGVTPAMNLAYQSEVDRRLRQERHRERLRLKREEEERQRALEEQLGALRGLIGSGEARRQLAQIDFPEAAKAALAIGGAELLSARESYNEGEMVVQFRFRERRFECVCEKDTMRIIDSGICLQAGGVRGDTLLTLESLIPVIGEAIRTRRLHIYRHVDGGW